MTKSAGQELALQSKLCYEYDIFYTGEGIILTFLQNHNKSSYQSSTVGALVVHQQSFLFLIQFFLTTVQTKQTTKSNQITNHIKKKST